MSDRSGRNTQATDEGVTVLLGPALELVEIFLVEMEHGAAVRARDDVDAVAAGLTPGDDGAEGEAIALTKVGDDLHRAGAKGLDAFFGNTNKIAHGFLREDVLGRFHVRRVVAESLW